MESTNLVRRMKELINIIKEADVAYFVNDNPTMSDNEYDKLVAELKGIEHETGIVFSDSPSKRVGGNVKEELKSVTHTKPMLSAKKTKCIGDVLEFAANKDVVVSWKLDGLTIVLRYENGELKQAITRGKDGLIGEDVTHTVRHFRNVPLKVPCKDIFEVRGEGVCSWSDFEIIKKNEGPTHPRNVAAGTVRTLTADEGKLSHLDFVAFELIDSNKDWNSKLEQLEFLENNKFSVVEHSFVGFGSDDIESEIGKYNPDTYFYPVDGVVIEYEDLKYGKSLGATAHHENRLIALKWEDAEYETIFRGVELATGRTGTVEINAIFDPVDIGGMMVRRANVHGLSGFEKLKLGVGDTIKVYKANMIIPQVSENLTKSGTFKLSEFCPCCGAKLEIKISNTGVRSLYCPNEDCLARNAQKIARFCDKKAMNIRREELFEDYLSRKYADHQLKSMADYAEWKESYDAKSKSQSKFVKERLMRNVDMFSNGESAMRYFVDHVTENALYLLDEPENSLSIALQQELCKYIVDSARHFGCQFIMATHSPILLSIKDALIYDLDSDPVKTSDWTELENVRRYFDFFEEHRNEFI